MRKRKNNKIKFNITFFIAIILIAIFCFETIGYAIFSQVLTINGTASFQKVGELEIIKIEQGYFNNATEASTPTYSGLDVNYNITFSCNQSNPGTAVYYVTIKNNNVIRYTYNGFNINATITQNSSSGEVTTTIEGLNQGDVIEPGDEIELTVTFSLTSSTTVSLFGSATYTTYTVTANGTVDKTTSNLGDLYASFTSSLEGDLRTLTRVPFTISVMNSYDYDYDFTISSTSSKLKLVDSNGNSLSTYTIYGGNTESYTFYVELEDSATFNNEYINSTIYLNYGSKSKKINTIKIQVNQELEEEDIEPPTISNLTVTKDSTDGSLTLNWNGEDDSDILKYYILLYSVNGSTETLQQTYNTTSSETSYTIKNLDPGYYSFKVYGEDNSENNNKPTQTEIDNATTSSGSVMKVESAYYRWYVNVTYNLTYTSSSNTDSKVPYGEAYSTTLSVGSEYTLGTPTVKVGNTTYTSGTQYSYSNKKITIYAQYVTDDITISCTSTKTTCLIEGTKVLLHNGKYKNIEDITYSDLLSVWSYDTGSIDYEYPILIEYEGTAKSYQLTTFSDGTTLKTVGYHGIFNADLNKYVSIDNKDEFNIGTKVVKIIDGKINYVKVVNIEYIEKEVKFYHVESTRYFNVITDDVLTTDGNTILNNLYGFDKNLKWINKLDTAYDYSYFKGISEKYMYVGMRMGEIYNIQTDHAEFIKYLVNTGLSGDVWTKPNKKGNKYIFYVSTNTGLKTTILEDNYYRLPNTYKYWKNSVDNKIYNANELVKIECSTHFIGFN